MIINKLDELINNTNMFVKFTRNIDNVDVNIYTYMYFNPVEYFNIKDIPFKKEIRGLTYIDGRFFPTIHKFFNIGENQYVLNWDDINNNNKLLSIEKIDGSLISPVIINNKLYIKSKTSFNSKQVNDVNKYNLLSDYQKDIIKTLINKYELYPQFEYVSPTNRIVLEYKEPELVLLCIRRKVSELNFEYVDIDTLKDISKDLNIRIPNIEFLTKSELIELQNNSENIEGYVIQYNNELYKIKTKWYFDKHKLRPDNLSETTVMKLILDEDIDDLLSELEDGDIIKIQIETYVNKIINKLNKEYIEISKVKEIFDTMDIKDFALKYPQYCKYISVFKKSNDIKNIVKNEWDKKYKKLSNIINDFGTMF